MDGGEHAERQLGFSAMTYRFIARTPAPAVAPSPSRPPSPPARPGTQLTRPAQRLDRRRLRPNPKSALTAQHTHKRYTIDKRRENVCMCVAVGARIVDAV